MKAISNFKIQLITLIIFSGIFFAGCETESGEIDLENNEELRNEVFNEILSNEEVFYEFVEQMRENTTAMGWTMNNREFTREMFRKENMKRIRKHNPEMDNRMMDDMITRMEEDTTVAKEMNRRMQERRLFHGDVMMLDNE